MIVPIHIFILQQYSKTPLNYHPTFGHLWFLLNIVGYTIVLSPLLFLIRKQSESKPFRFIQNIMNTPFLIYLFLIPFILETFIIKPKAFTTYIFTPHGTWLGLLFFLFGFIIVSLGKPFWKSLAKLKVVNLILATSLFLIRWLYLDFRVPMPQVSAESILWIYTILGFGYSYLNRPNQTFAYLTKAAYPVYIIHMITQYFISYFIVPLSFHPLAKFVVITVFTFALSLALYEYMIRRTVLTRWLFGIK